MKAKTLFLLILLLSVTQLLSKSAKLLWQQRGLDIQASKLLFSNDGKTLFAMVEVAADTGYVREIEEWDVETGEFLYSFKSPANLVNMAISPDGSRLLGADLPEYSTILTEFDLLKNSFMRYHEFKKSNGFDQYNFIWSYSYFQDTNKIAVFYGGTNSLDIYRTGDDQLDFKIELGTRKILAVQFYKNGTMAAVAFEDKKVDLINLETGLRTASFDIGIPAYRLDISADGNYLFAACQSDSSLSPLRIFELPSGIMIEAKPSEIDFNYGGISHDGSFYTNYNSTLSFAKIFKFNDPHFVVNIQGTIEGYCTAFSPIVNKMAFYDSDYRIHIANLETGNTLIAFSRFSGLQHAGSVWDVKFSPDGQSVLSSGSDGKIKLWGSNDGKFIRTLQVTSAQVRSMDFSPDGTTLAAGTANDSLFFINASNYARINSKSGQNYVINKVKWIPGANPPALAYSGWDKGISVCSPTGTDPGYYIDTTMDHVPCFNFSKSGELLIAGSRNKHVKVWKKSDTSEDKWVELADIIAESTSWSNGIASADFCDNESKLVTIAYNGPKIKLWDAQNFSQGAQIMIEPANHIVGTNSIMLINKVGNKVLTGDIAGFIRIHEILFAQYLEGRIDDFGEEILQNKPNSAINALCLSENEKLLAVGTGDGTVMMFDVSEFFNDVDDTPSIISRTEVYPNPSQSFLNLKIKSPNPGQLTITLFDPIGNNMATLDNTYTDGGDYFQHFDIEKLFLPNGIYFIKIENADKMNIEKIIICN